MTQPPRQLLSLWDHGWLDHIEIRLPPCAQPRQMVKAYLHSDTFGTSFVGQERGEEPVLHGPFWRTSVKADDFKLIDSKAFYEQIQNIRHPEGFSVPANQDQWNAVEDLITGLESQSQWRLMLGLTEKDESRFHDWGSVLHIFREFILANPNSENVSILVFGYD